MPKSVSPPPPPPAGLTATTLTLVRVGVGVGVGVRAGVDYEEAPRVALRTLVPSDSNSITLVAGSSGPSEPSGPGISGDLVRVRVRLGVGVRVRAGVRVKVRLRLRAATPCLQPSATRLQPRATEAAALCDGGRNVPHAWQVTGCAGRFALDVLRALVRHQP